MEPASLDGSSWILVATTVLGTMAPLLAVIGICVLMSRRKYTRRPPPDPQKGQHPAEGDNLAPAGEEPQLR